MNGCNLINPFLQKFQPLSGRLVKKKFATTWKTKLGASTQASDLFE